MQELIHMSVGGWGQKEHTKYRRGGEGSGCENGFDLSLEGSHYTLGIKNSVE